MRFLPLLFLDACFVAVVCFQWVSCTIYRTLKPFFSTKLSLKMGHTVLFIYLKIISLQCFQFLVFSKISGIQTYPNKRYPNISCKRNEIKFIILPLILNIISIVIELHCSLNPSRDEYS